MAKLKHFLQEIISIFKEQEERFILWVPVFIAFGIGAYFSLPFEPVFWSSLTILIIVGLILLVNIKIKIITRLEIIILIILLGFSAASFRAYMVNSPMLEKRTEPINIIGEIEKIENLPDKKGFRLTLYNLEIEDFTITTPQKVRIQIFSKSTKQSLLIGDKISVLAILNPPSAPVISGAFDFRRYMFFQKIGATGFAVGSLKLLRKNTDKTGSFYQFWEELRQKVKNRIHAAILDNNIASSLVVALLTGERGEISKKTWEHIRSAGLAHLLAISGLHIGLVAGLIFFVTRFFLSMSEFVALNFSTKKISALFAMIGVVFYLFLVGAPVSAERATIMTLIILFAILIDREAISLRLAMVAATIILLIAPESLLSAGFHMSFAAVVSLIAFYELLSLHWRKWYKNSNILRKIMLYLLGVILTTIIASLATAPFSLYHFGKVADYASILANIVAVPITSFIVMPAGIIALLLMPLGWEHVPLIIMADAVEFIYKLAYNMTIDKERVIYTPIWPISALVLISIGALWLAIWQDKLRLWGAAIIILGVFLAVWGSPKMQADIYIADMGKIAAVRIDDNNLAVSSLRKEKFTSKNWHKMTGINNIEMIKWPTDGAIKENFTCDWQACIWYKDNTKIIFVINPIAFVKNCERYEAIIIAMKYNIPQKCKAKITIDRFDLWRYGAHSVFIDKNKITVKNVASNIGNRYWTPKRFEGF